MNTHTITINLKSNMSIEEVEQWINEAIETDLQSHLLEGETIEVKAVK